MVETESKTYDLLAEPVPDTCTHKPGAWRVILNDLMPVGYRKVVVDNVDEQVARFLARHARADEFGRIVEGPSVSVKYFHALEVDGTRIEFGADSLDELDRMIEKSESRRGY